MKCHLVQSLALSSNVGYNPDSAIFLLDIFLEKFFTCAFGKLFKAVLIIIAKSRNNLNILSHIAWYIHSMEYYTGSKNKCTTAIGINTNLKHVEWKKQITGKMQTLWYYLSKIFKTEKLNNLLLKDTYICG